ncbi:MAG: excinuclease ABC subunit UvrA, partial [Clostridia bacterium]|nr:excinuclease ABC subunit UvrA [Clostridia bacterium]
MNENIIIKGAKEHNLKNVSLTIPRNKLVVLTGLSGSGKSSLAFDTIYAEGQRRYMESLSSYARQFLGQMNKPNVESIEGLSPAISIDQKTTSKNPRSTVGTVTEIYDYLRLLYARIGTPHCPICGREITNQSIDQIVDKIMDLGENTKIQVLAPIASGKKGEYAKEFENAKKSGFVRVRVDGKIHDLSETIKLNKNQKHSIEIIVDRIVIDKDSRSRITDAVETAAEAANGIIIVNINMEKDIIFSKNFACPEHNIAIGELTPRMFSFNSPFGACKKCTGLGVFMEIDPNLIIPDDTKSINQGGIKGSGWSMEGNSIAYMYYRALAKKYNFSLDTPLCDLPKEIINIILYGTKG